MFLIKFILDLFHIIVKIALSNSLKLVFDTSDIGRIASVDRSYNLKKKTTTDKIRRRCQYNSLNHCDVETNYVS